MGHPQLNLDFPATLPRSIYDYGQRTSGETHGVVLTKPHIVSLILDIARYVPERDLAAAALLEPSCGHGAFVVQAVDRLLVSAKKFARAIADLKGCIRAFDIDPSHVDITRAAVVTVLQSHGVSRTEALALAKAWIACADYLLESQPSRFEFVVGNPPYVRIEQLPAALQNEYRRRYESIYDRADLYIAFIERSLNLLSPHGVLAFICADRWILNKYGAPLRRLLSERFSIRCFLDLHRASPFDTEVVAYPSIFAISPGNTNRVHVGALDTGSANECAAALASIEGGKTAPDDGKTGVRMSVYDEWFEGDEPWVLSTPSHLEVLRDLERRFSPIETTARVGIGVATGCDKVYIVGADADIEPDRLVPLVMRNDIVNGKIGNSQRFVINTFDQAGGVVDLARFPRLARYLETHNALIRRRHVSKKNPKSWFRTIDRVYPDLVPVPKLLIPDIAGSNEVVYDAGHYHPHHNLYFVGSDSWDMEILGGLLSSKVALFFVWSYAVKMRGGYLRFQAQYLRRIRLPAPDSIPKPLGASIRAAFKKRDFAKLDALACEVYGVSKLPAFEFLDTRR